jgi:uncharacterized beta-barrel protein YwiB (DUF1934 family)
MNDMNYSQGPIVLERQTVKIKLASRHIVHDMDRFARYGDFMTMFDPSPIQRRGDVVDPEDYPEEMSEALSEMLERENGVIGYPTEEELMDYCSDDGDEEDDFSPMQSFSEKLELFLKLLDSDEGTEDDSFVFETLGTIEKVLLEDGKQVIEISYTEGESMDDTNTVIRFDPLREGSVSIYHTGSVVSALVCEEGVRHITVYQTPVAPFEIALYTKKCRGGFTFSMGGVMELDYIVELRGADLQRTIMKIDVEPVKIAL